ncbi:MGMT family protein [Nocardioides zeae]
MAAEHADPDTQGPAPDHAELVLRAVEAVPPGRVTTYGAIADLVGGGPRRVARVMSRDGAGSAGGGASGPTARCRRTCTRRRWRRTSRRAPRCAPGVATAAGPWTWPSRSGPAGWTTTERRGIAGLVAGCRRPIEQRGRTT